MRKLILLFGGIAGFSVAFSQTLSPEVIASSGTTLMGTSAGMQYTIGEVATATLTASGNTLTQGFNQPNIVIVAIEEFNDIYTINLYPNPTEEFVTIATNNTDELQVQIFNALGQLVIAPQDFKEKIVLDVHAMSNGSYLISVSRKNGERLKNFNVIKRSTN